MARSALATQLAAANARIAALEADLVTAGKAIEALRLKCATTAPVAADYRRPAAEHRNYADYVAACRQAQRAAGHKTISYLSFAQWSQALEAECTH